MEEGRPEGENNQKEGKTAGRARKEEQQYERFDVEDALRAVEENGRAQIQRQMRRLHPFRPEWIGQLTTRYRERPGKPIVHLSDLPHKTAIRVSDEGKVILQNLWGILTGAIGSRMVRKFRLEGVWGYAIAHYYEYLTLETLHRANIIGWKVDSIEPHVTHLKSHKNNCPKDVQPRLPHNFLSEDGAAILGYYTDSKHGTCAFSNKDLELHDFMKNAVERVVGQIESSSYTYEGVTDTCWSLYLRTVVDIAGINTAPRQKVADNPAPLWLFTAPKPVIAAYLRALWSAEGEPESMRITQAKAIPELAPFNAAIPQHRDHVATFNELPEDAKEIVRASPSLLLTSAVLLHNALGLDVGFRPILAYIDFRDEPTIEWTIEITSIDEIRKFAQLVNFDSSKKRELLDLRIKRNNT